jgi:hypothetical protein
MNSLLGFLQIQVKVSFLSGMHSEDYPSKNMAETLIEGKPMILFLTE